MKLCLFIFWLALLNAPAGTNLVLRIDPASQKIPGAKLTLNVGELRRTNDVFGGSFQMKVSPWFFKSEKGALQMTITDQDLSNAAKGMVIEVKGTALADGKQRQITAVATPTEKDHGALKLTIVADDRTLVFLTAYRLVLD